MVRSRQSAISVVWCQAFEEQYLKSSKRGCLQKTLHPYIGFVIDITALVFVANRQAGVEQLGAQQAGDLIIHYDIGYRH